MSKGPLIEQRKWQIKIIFIFIISIVLIPLCPSSSHSLTRNSMILPIHHLGLSNRLRMLASAQQVAVEANRSLYVDWRPSESCNVLISDLFNVHAFKNTSGFQIYNGTLVTLYQLSKDVTAKKTRKEFVHIPSGLSVLVIRHRGATFDINEILGFDVVILLVTGFFQASHISCQEYYFRKQSFYRSLELQEGIANEFQALKRKVLDKSLVVGVHVRLFDSVHDWATIPPPSDSTRREALIFDEAAPLYLFVQAMQQMLDRYPRIKFYVASNSKAAKQALVGHFSNDVVIAVDFPMRTLTRDSRIGIQIALLEWMVLAHTAIILHSFGSSYAEEAAQLHLIPTIRIRKGGNVMGPDLTLPFCNNHVIGNQVAKSFTNATAQEHSSSKKNLKSGLPYIGDFDRTFLTHYGELSCFEDEFQGEVCTKPYKTKLCRKIIESWGVSPVYC